MHVVVVGCGRVGSRLATELADEGHSVAVLDRHATSFSRLPERFSGTTVVGVSLVTNLAAGLQDRVTHSEVLEVAGSSTGALLEVLRAAVATA